ncbi:pilin [Endozoicomonas gorgoniicola]|uniref:Pilin n=1 Tax=Endozoicomonas gorgoniicola TaxID=1234144 RepID=A0ABT3MXX8_9GAMM|nr:pilin [Endozoicomonas gorgoniicola]
MAAGFATLQNLKGPVEEFFLTEGKFPTSNDDKDQIGVTASSLGEITLSKDEKVAGAGTVTFTFGDKAKPETKGKTLLLARDKDGGWGCKAGGIDNKYLPATCRAADTKTADTKTTETPKID